MKAPGNKTHGEETMEVEKVKDLLSRYAANKGRAARLEAEIGKLELEARKIRAMEADTLKASTVDGMPRRKGGKSDPTGKKAVQLAEGASGREEARILEKISVKKADLNQLRLDVQLVDGWLGALMEREKLIIAQQMEYKRTFGDQMSDDTLRRMRDRAIEFIARQM